MDVEVESVCEHGEERGKTFDGVNERDGNFGGCGGGEKVAANLKGSEWQRGSDDIACGRANAMLESGDVSAQDWVCGRELGEEEAPGRDESKLYESQRDGFWEGVEDRL